MRLKVIISGLLVSLVLKCGCGSDRTNIDSKTRAATSYVATVRKEIIAQNVLAAQLAPHHEFEGKTTFAATEPIPASLYLTNANHVEPRRISAFLLQDELVVEEQSIAVSENEERRDFDFRFSKEPRPIGNYEIKFVEIARSNGKPVLLARLFLDVQ
jgi:hypothetical protein